MELLVNGYRSLDTAVQRDNEYIKTFINGVEKDTRRIQSFQSPIDADDYFVFHEVFGQYDDVGEEGRYFVFDRRLIPSVFEGLFLEFETFGPDSSGRNQTIRKGKVDTDLRCASNADWKLIDFNLIGFRVTIYVSYFCKGYTGRGCQYETDENPNAPYEYDYETGKRICKNPQTNNPPACDRFDDQCDNSLCSNHGKCVKIVDNLRYCMCDTGFMGNTCNVFNCTNVCDPDHGSCLTTNVCDCKSGWSGPTCAVPLCQKDVIDCKNGGICVAVNNALTCECDPTNFGGKFCELKCDPPCLFGTCINNEGAAYCNCLDGFIGANCNDTLQVPPPKFSEYYVSPRYQKIIYVCVTGGLVLIGILSIGIGSYFRSHRKRAKRVTTAAQQAVNTITAGAATATTAIRTLAAAPILPNK